MKEQEKETGQSVLQLGQIFHEKVLFIKKQLGFQEHPLRQIFEKFKILFCDSNLMLLCKSAAEECKDDLTVSTHSSKLDYIHRTLLKVINLFVEAFISFYSLEDQIKGEKDLRRELLFNLVTNFILEGELYFIVYNLTSGAMEEALHKLRNIMGSKELLEN
jgi:hypothetical protein